MQLTQNEVEQLKTAGFDEQHIEEIQVAKTGALQNGQNWLDLLTKLVENGPKIIALLKLFGGLFTQETPK